MSKIVVESVTIARKVDLGQGIFVVDMAPFSKTGSIRPGQFVHIRIPGSDVYFRRAFSVYDTNPREKSISVIFKVFGRGTSLLAQLHEGDELDILGPLGNSFKLPSKRETVIFAAGGIGLPPLYLLARRLIEKNYDPKKMFFFYGGASRTDLVEMKRIKKLSVRLFPATDDGSFGFAGLVTEAITSEIDKVNGRFRIYACGPEAMLKAVDLLAREYHIPGQLSLEAPMPCGIGICLGCVLPLRAGGYTRVCREGPVYNVGEVIL